MWSRFFKREQKLPASPFEQLGGENAVRNMAERFYDIMSTDPAAGELLAIHPQPMDAIRQKFFEFLCGWLGGPRYYEEKYGHPRLRARHMPFAIDTKMRDQWLHCMYQVLDEQVEDKDLKHELRQRFTALAHHMINQPSSV
ncbi:MULTISPECIES: group II truncated hemoglobin [Gammaproteobacteria]|uniref:group II truncated hemoglobin n=1 Tax=Gammaproteobacteria TaxID=1236 RepID=UPI000DD0556F|nr:MULTISPECIES: group II truncated hemoglobin [Gammaproteobacteria]RTE86663.1 hemoglobin-like oxygen-binding protein [Aliidiomarina sp. B3213]TCZ90784.1 hemoglobin-like oxygen-binding protein [Lysobacter sp. N42]